MQYYELVVVMPVGPACRTAFIADTLHSIAHYTSGSYKIVLADDSQQGTGKTIQHLFPDADVVPTPHSMGKLCGLYVTLSMAFQHVLRYYHFDALLRIDTDALMTGPDPHREAAALFKNKHIGLAGQYPLDYEGEPWDVSWPKAQLHTYTATYKFFKHPVAHARLRRLLQKAQQHGYRNGESVFGGACFYSEHCLHCLQEAGLLPNLMLKDVTLEEDHLFSLLVKSIDMHFGSLSGTDGPMACAWVGLPASPTALSAAGKKIIHSVRKWQNQSEEDIRHYFRQQRLAEKKAAHVHTQQ